MLYKLVCFFAGHKPYYTEYSTSSTKKKGHEHVTQRKREIPSDHCSRCMKPNKQMSKREIDKMVNDNATNLIKSFEDHLKGN